MRSRITVITLGVENLERSVQFYRDGLGLPTEGIIGQEFEYGAVAFFNLQLPPMRSIKLWSKPKMRAPLLLNRLTTHFGAVMPVISKTPTGICGKWCGIHSFCRTIEAEIVAQRPNKPHNTSMASFVNRAHGRATVTCRYRWR